MKKTLRILLVVVLVLLVAALGGGLYGAYRVSQLDTNFPKLSVNGIPVGGLTKAQTAEALNAAGRSGSQRPSRSPPRAGCSFRWIR